MEKFVLFAISPYNKRYYFNPIAKNLPFDIKLEIKKIGIYFVNKLNCIFSIGFYQSGDFFINCSSLDDISYDDIGVNLEIKRFQLEKKEFINSLKLWYLTLVKNNIDLKGDLFES